MFITEGFLFENLFFKSVSSALGAAAIGGKMLVAGGYDGISSLNSVELYDLKTDTWVFFALTSLLS
jgi:hypothetical protein